MSSETGPGRRQSLCVGFICLLIGIGYGVAYGLEGGNQLVYLPPGLRLIDPGLLRQDWWAANTSVYHIAFSYLIASLAWLHLLPWGPAVANVILAAATYWCLFRLIQCFIPEHAFAAWVLFIFLFLGIARSESVAVSYLFDAELQASSIASFATVLAMYLFITGRPLGSGIALGVAGIFHANFLILGIMCFGLAQLMLGWQALISRSIKQLAPSLLVLAVQVPLILTISGYDLPSEMRAEAQRLVIEVAAPHHYQPRLFFIAFIPLILWNVVALAMLGIFPGDAENRRKLKAIYASFLLVVLVGTLLTTVVRIDFVARLFVWRMAPFLLACAHVIIAASAIRYLADRNRAGGGLLLAGACLLLVMAVVFFAVRVSIFDPRAWIAFVGLIGCFAVWRSADGNAREAGSYRLRLAVLTVMCLIGTAILRVPNILGVTTDGFAVTRNFNLLAVPAVDVSRVDLYRWARTTDRDARFLIPPMLSGFRLHGQRAVYVDWKGRPFRPDELIEWHRRIRSITGLDRWRNPDELDEAYDALDEAQLRSIVESYNIRYVVLHKAARRGRSLGDVVFENDIYVVVRIRDGVASGAHRWHTAMIS